MKIWKSEKIIEVRKCTDCPNCEETQDVIGPEAYTSCAKVNHLEYTCKITGKFLGYLDWKDGQWIGTFSNEIPKDCPLPDKELNSNRLKEVKKN